MTIHFYFCNKLGELVTPFNLSSSPFDRMPVHRITMLMTIFGSKITGPVSQFVEDCQMR